MILEAFIIGVAALIGFQDDPPPSLDDLLGIDGEGERHREGEDAATAERQQALDRALAEKKPAAALTAAIQDMNQSSVWLGEDQTTGLGVQRLQRRIIDRLQALIDSAQRQQDQQPSPSSSNSDSGQDPGSRSKDQQEGEGEGKGQQGQQQTGGESLSGEAPPPEHRILESQLDETRIEWGTLPPRVRELINQGMRDRMSELYRSMTEAYYKRMAEDASK
jgi:hypothetical protein